MMNVLNKAIVVFCTGLLVSLNVYADDRFDELRRAYNKAFFSNDCETAIPLLYQVIEINPEAGNRTLGTLHLHGDCLDQDYYKAIEAFKKVPEKILKEIQPFEFNFLQFSRARTKAEKDQVLNSLKDIFYGNIIYYGNVEETENQLIRKFKNHFEYWAFINPEIIRLKRIEEDPTLKLNKVESLIIEGNYLDLAKYWLTDLLHIESTIGKANYLYGQNFTKDNFSLKRRMQYSAWNGYPKGQAEFARLSTKENSSVHRQRAYYWFNVAFQNGEPVLEEMREFKKTLSQFDIEFVEYELSRGNNSIFRID